MEDRSNAASLSNYRPEIDGLRAIAVAAVVFYHAGYSWAPGGFVGVDVFFVISGYLITGILLNEQGRAFDVIRHFYVRRIRRIVPALLLVLATTTVASTVVLPPGQLHDYFRSLIASLAFVANIFFWLESGYFGIEAELTPLIHLWSLSVEEQFYLFVPLIFVFLAGRKNILIAITALLGVLSLIGSIWVTKTIPDLAFFMLPFRAFELLVGSGLAIAYHNRASSFGALPGLARASKEFGAFVGVFAIAWAVVIFDESTSFPGVAALLPTIGTACVIAFCSKGTFLYQLLSSRVFVTIGLISYSLYLWHYPMFALSRHLDVFHVPMVVELLIIISVVLSLLTWRFVEQPFRRPDAFSTKKVLLWAGAMSVLFVGVSIIGHNTKGFRDIKMAAQMEPSQRLVYEIIERHTEHFTVFDDGLCRFSMDEGSVVDTERFQACADQHGPATVVVGDSHGINVYNIIAQSNQQPFVVGMVMGGCRPHELRPACDLPRMLDFLVDYEWQIAQVIYHQSGSSYIADELGQTNSGRAFDGGAYAMETATIREIMRFLTDVELLVPEKLWWLGPFVEFRNEPIDAVFDEAARFVNPHSHAAFLELDQHTRSLIEPDFPVPYVSFSELFEVPRQAIIGDCFIFRDRDHFSNCGERLLADALDLGSQNPLTFQVDR